MTSSWPEKMGPILSMMSLTQTGLVSYSLTERHSLMLYSVGDLNDEQRVALRKVINQASPVLPYLQADEDWQHPDLLDLPERAKTIIVHMRCSSGAEAATENASFFLNNRSGTYHPLLYMKFDAHDIRFNTCEAMLRTFIARISCNRLQTENTVSRTMDTLINFEALHRVTLFNEAERLQSIQGELR